jgi:ribonuclease BN (tRNA processing enzyme)
MKLTVLGCSGSVPGPGSPASGYLIEADGYALVLDLGHGAFGALQQHIAPTAVRAIVLSHLHADHCIDLTAYFVALRYGGTDQYRLEPGARLPVIGPSGTRARLETAYDPWARKLGVQELFGFRTPSTTELGPLRLSFAPANHPVPTSAVRIEHGGRSLVYSADTGESPQLVELAAGADVLLCEATMMPEWEYVPDLHLTGAQAGEHAARAGVGRLLLTHIPPWGSVDVATAEAASTFSGPVEAVRAGESYEI